MYHYISVPPADADVYRHDLSVTPANFEAQLAWLRGQGYQSITLFDLVYHLALGWPLPDRPVILTFDDGYRDNYTHAFPLLKKFDYVGTFFLVTAPIDGGDPAYLSWDMVKEMHQAGMDFQPHSYRHFDLRGKDMDFLIFEILAPKEAIEARIGETTYFFSYPSGSYDRQTVAVLQSAYFWGAVITEQGATHTSDNLFELNRVRVRGEHTLQDFVDLMAYDW
jgi:peptidoglycan/xylan/chitin deacetylase (PgdA/CDA1 family)